LYAPNDDAYSDTFSPSCCGNCNVRRLMIEYEPLHQFVELTRTMHFGRAARACHVSPSTLSRQVQRLETQLGEQLFEREHHKVTLTPAGEQFRRHALAVLDEWHRFERERAELSGELNGTLHVYCTVTAAQSIVPDLFGRLRRSHPGVRIELQTGYSSDAIDQLRGGEVDATIAALPERLPVGVATRELTTTPVVFVAPNIDGPVRDRITRRRIDWTSVPLVLPTHGLAREYADDWLEQRALTPNLYAEIEGHEAILALVALGCGVGVVPKLVLEKSSLRRRITEIPVKPALPPFHIALCVRERSLVNPLVRALWEA
jgi:LysR family transcriptional regulator, positive regulator for ilvC